MTDTTVFGSALADAIKLASSAVDKIYHGANAVWPHDYDIEYLIVAGGGGGAGTLNTLGSSRSGGAGGAGGMLEATGVSLQSGTAYTIRVGAGGAGGSSHGTKGSDSSFDTIATAKAAVVEQEAKSPEVLAGLVVVLAGHHHYLVLQLMVVLEYARTRS